jgi:hypothetical protein
MKKMVGYAYCLKKEMKDIYSEKLKKFYNKLQVYGC